MSGRVGERVGRWGVDCRGMVEGGTPEGVLVAWARAEMERWMKECRPGIVQVLAVVLAVVVAAVAVVWWRWWCQRWRRQHGCMSVAVSKYWCSTGLQGQERCDCCCGGRVY